MLDDWTPDYKVDPLTFWIKNNNRAGIKETAYQVHDMWDRENKTCIPHLGGKSKMRRRDGYSLKMAAKFTICVAYLFLCY